MASSVAYNPTCLRLRAENLNAVSFKPASHTAAPSTSTTTYIQLRIRFRDPAAIELMIGRRLRD